MSDLPNFKVFISYSRADTKFADELAAGLEFKEEFSVMIDRQSIVEGEEWKERLSGLIADADTIVFILSPDSAKSPICAWEVEEAHRLSKRILPVLARSTGSIPVPPLLAAINYVRFDEDRSFMAGLAALVRSLKTDVSWLREHTRLLSRAMEWNAAGRPSNRLLSGNDITAAKDWLASRPKDAPDATVLHLDFVRASERAEVERENAERHQLEEIASAQSQRALALHEREAALNRLHVWTRRGLAAGVIGAIGGAGLAYWGYNAERRVRNEQENARRAAAEALEQAIEKEASRTDLLGQLVAYAAAPGQYADDGPAGGNSPFTDAMIKALTAKSVSLLGAIALSNKRVLELTHGRQRPYYTSDLNGDVYLFRQPSTRQLLGLMISVDRVEGHTATLTNVARDATAWAELLKRAGFQTAMLTNPKHTEMLTALEMLSSPALRERRGALEARPLHPAALLIEPVPAPKPYDTLVVVFYSGVGFTFNGIDYLAASDTRIDLASDIANTSINLRRTLESLRTHNAVTIIALDTNFSLVAPAR